MALLGVCQPAVAVLRPRVRQQGQQAILHGNQALPVLLRLVNLLQVAQHARDDVAWRRGLQIEPERHFEFVHQAAVALVRLEPLGEFLTRE
jgi:hypothetical protein